MKIKSKSKKAKTSKIKDIKPTITEQELKPIDERGYPIPRSEVCFRCNQRGTSIQFSTKNMKAKVKNKAIDKNGYPVPRNEKCFKCKKKFYLVFSFPKQSYSLKNSWFYYTEREEDKEKYICSPCLRSFYIENRQEFLATIKNLQKRNNLRSYISDKLI